MTNRFPKSVRIKGYDYASPGAYFVTICTHQRSCVFGRIEDCRIHLSALGRIVTKEWQTLSSHYNSVTTDACVVMPNHFHGILVLSESARLYMEGWLDPVARAINPHDAASCVTTMRQLAPRALSLSAIVRSFKSGVTRRARMELNLQGQVWQPDFHEHIIRDDVDLSNHRQYIINNPGNWAADL